MTWTAHWGDKASAALGILELGGEVLAGKGTRQSTSPTNGLWGGVSQGRPLTMVGVPSGRLQQLSSLKGTQGLPLPGRRHREDRMVGVGGGISGKAPGSVAAQQGSTRNARVSALHTAPPRSRQ